MELDEKIRNAYFAAKGRNESPRLAKDLQASHTVIPAIRMANRNRPFAEGMIFHSDQDIQYTCQQTINLLKS